MPSVVLKKATIFRKLFFGPKGEKQQEIFHQILNDTDTNFTKWAVYAILHWQNAVIPKNVVHIHGTSDKLLPYRLVKADYSVEKGTHLMVMNQPGEISSLLKQIIIAP
jgi:hypothetical protein